MRKSSTLIYTYEITENKSFSFCLKSAVYYACLNLEK